MYLTYLMQLNCIMKVLCKATQEVFKLPRELKFPEFCILILANTLNSARFPKLFIIWRLAFVFTFFN